MNVTPESSFFRDYRKKIAAAETLPALRAELEAFRPFADDAWNEQPLDETEFTEFRAGLQREGAGNGGAGEEWLNRYLHILLPNLLCAMELKAYGNRTSWGTAFLSSLDSGEIVKGSDGIYHFSKTEITA